MNNSVLHLSHTDVRADSRILKELDAIEGIGSLDIFAVGVDRNEGVKNHDALRHVHVDTLSLRTLKLIKLLPRPLRLFTGVIFLVPLELWLRLIIRGTKLRPTIIHCHDALCLPAAWAIKIIVKSRLIYDAHELESQTNGQRPLFSKMTFFFERVIWKHISLFISVSPSIINWYNTNLGEKKSILILNSPVIKQKKISPSDVVNRENLRDVFNIPQGSLIFVYVGILMKGRGINIYLDAFSNPPVNAHLIFVGYGELSELISRTAETCTNIHLHAPVPHDRLVGLLASADFGLCLIENVSLSDYYCLPNKLFEYAFAGLKVVVSKFPDMDQIVSQYQLGMSCDVDKESLRQLVLRCESQDLVHCVSDITDLSWEAQSARLTSAYRELLNGQPK